jgi:hypothetical protein
MVAGALVFGVLATMNAAGYRYGVADQAFYVPAVLRHLDPSLYPQDGWIIASQAKLLIFDELFAAAHRATGVPLPWMFFGGYVATMAALFGALVAFGRSIYASGWTVAALVFAATLRHRITKTGANTLEGHFHPRMLAFAIGVFALAAVMRRRTAIAVGLIAIAGVLHPTTAIFFAAWVGVALLVNEPALRRPLAIAAGAAVVIGAIALASGIIPLSFARMDDQWMAAFAEKDYIFPTAWNFEAWLLNLIYPVIIVIAWRARVRAGVAHPNEAGVVAGCLALVGIFLATLPFVAMRSALIVQLQISRVFWMADLLAIAYVIWAIAALVPSPLPLSHRRGVEKKASPLLWERGQGERGPTAPAAWRAQALAVVLALVAAGRGWYVLTVEHAGRPLVELDLPADDWRDVSAWLRSHTPKEAQVLADPGHAFKYGLSLRVSAERDVFLEDVKDASIAFYDRRIALRVLERRAAWHAADVDANQTISAADRLQDLTSRYDLSYVVTEQPLPLPEAYRNARFHVYGPLQR